MRGIARLADRALSSDDLRKLTDDAIRSLRVVDLQVDELGDMAPLRRRDGESVWRAPQRELYSTAAVIGADPVLLETADVPDAPTTSRAAVKAELAPMELGIDQAAAVEQILCGLERITVLIGPAGTGKTHTQRAASQTGLTSPTAPPPIRGSPSSSSTSTPSRAHGFTTR